MKVVFTVGQYYPRTDGVQAVTTYLAEGMAKKGIHVTVVTRMFDGLATEEKHNGVTIIRYNITTSHAVHRGDIEGYRKLIINLTKEADALIAVCPQIVTTDALLPILDKIHCKKILYMHGMHTFRWSKYDFRTPLLIFHKLWNDFRWGILYFCHKSEFRQFDDIVQIHRFDGSYEFVEKQYQIKSTIIENACDDAFFDDRYDASITLPKHYIINVSNFIERKNQIKTIQAFYKSTTDKALVLIGSSVTPYYREMLRIREKCEKEYGHKEVFIYTGIPREQISTYVKKADLYIMESRWEVFPVSLIESMAAGVPFITTDVGIARYLPGGVVTNNEADTIYWINLFSNNEFVRKELGMAGKEYARKNLTKNSKVDELIAIINKEQ